MVSLNSFSGASVIKPSAVSSSFLCSVSFMALAKIIKFKSLSSKIFCLYSLPEYVPQASVADFPISRLRGWKSRIVTSLAIGPLL